MESKRLYYIDWLRALVILTLIPFHAALTYLRFGYVYIKAPVADLSALPFLIVTTPLGDFFMTLLFFVSGVASFYSFQKRGGGRYIGERLQKLMKPFLLGFLTICPVTAYLQALYEGYQGGFISFIPQFFFYKLFYYPAYAHLWFLLYLFVFSMMCVPLFRRWQRDESRLPSIGAFLSKGHRLLLPIGAIILLETFLRPFFDGKQMIVGDWANDAVYLSVFIFGYVYAADERIREGVKRYFKPSVFFGIIGLVGLFYANIMWQVLGLSDAYLSVVRAVSKGIYECAVIIFLLCMGQTHFNRGGNVIGYLTRASFPVYLLHFLPVTFFTLLLVHSPMPNFLKFLLTCALSYITVFLLYEAWRRVFALKAGVPLKES